MSGSMSSRGPGGKSALFKSPTFSSNSEANTEEGRLMEAASVTSTVSLSSYMSCTILTYFHTSSCHC
uniref:Uncharacterized protein n=1 Tax=Pundamilia nyererei TaxID=303518 RepID=A0A3B4H5Q6_9CICH